ncbi:MAG TPA: hypothetical protein VIT00_03755 [Terrimicrobiaceae bacterium]
MITGVPIKAGTRTERIIRNDINTPVHCPYVVLARHILDDFLLVYDFEAIEFQVKY